MAPVLMRAASGLEKIPQPGELNDVFSRQDGTD